MITCIGCECDDYNACVDLDGVPCHWVIICGDIGICSSCEDKFDNPEARLREAAAGEAN
jgi:hypothetical protein